MSVGAFLLDGETTRQCCRRPGIGDPVTDREVGGTTDDLTVVGAVVESYPADGLLLPADVFDLQHSRDNDAADLFADAVDVLDLQPRLGEPSSELLRRRGRQLDVGLKP